MIKKNFVNFLTISRAISGLVIFVLLSKGIDIFASILFFVFLASDFFDGFLARKWNVESLLGKNLEPICDFLFLLGTVLAFVLRGYLPFIPFATLGFILISNHIIWLLTPSKKAKTIISIFGFLSFLFITILLSFFFLTKILNIPLNIGIILLMLVFSSIASVNYGLLKNRFLGL